MRERVDRWLEEFTNFFVVHCENGLGDDVVVQVLTLIPGESRKILIGPCMGCKLVSMVINIFEAVDRIRGMNAGVYK